MIDWSFISPALGVASGICNIDDITHWPENKFINILKFRVKVERGSMNFSGIDDKGISTKLFEKYRKEVAEIAYSYHRGMLLDSCTFYWYEDEDIEHVQNRLGDMRYHIEKFRDSKTK